MQIDFLNSKSQKCTAFFVLLLLPVLFLAGCGNGGADRSGRVTVAGSTTLLPIIQAASEDFVAGHKSSRIDVQGGGSSVGIESAINETVDIGMSSREPKPEEMKQGLVKTPIAVDAIAIIVDPDNPVSALTSEQARKIFGGKITNWRQVGGKDQEIILVNRDEASGTREAFFKLLMNESPFLKKAIVQPGSGQVRSIVGATPGAIGYLSRGYVTKEVKVVALDGVRPTIVSIREGKYKLSRVLYLMTRGNPHDLAKSFIDYVLSSEVQHRIVGTAYEPISEVKK